MYLLNVTSRYQPPKMALLSPGLSKPQGPYLLQCVVFSSPVLYLQGLEQYLEDWRRLNKCLLNE